MRGTNARPLWRGLASALCAVLAPIGSVFMVLVEGPVVFSITALVRDAPEPEAEGTAIARLILDRLPVE